MIVYRTTDRIPVLIGDVKILVSPLSGDQYAKVGACTKMRGGVEVVDYGKMAVEVLRYCVKGVENLDVKYADGSDFSVEFDESGCLSEDCLTVLLQALDTTKLILIASSVSSGKFDPQIEGVKFDTENVTSTKKK